jgi:hypothetical protein
MGMGNEREGGAGEVKFASSSFLRDKESLGELSWPEAEAKINQLRKSGGKRKKLPEDQIMLNLGQPTLPGFERKDDTKANE